MITVEDIQKAKELMDSNDVPSPGYAYVLNENNEDEMIKLDDAGRKRLYEIFLYRKELLK